MLACLSAFLLLSLGAGEAEAAKKKKRCAKAQVRLTLKGKPKCVKPKVIKPIASKDSPGMRKARLAVGVDGLKLPPLKLVRKGRNYGTFRGPLSAAAEKRLLKAIAAGEKKAKAAVIARVKQLPATDADTAASASASAASPSLNVDFDPKTGDYSARGSVETTAKLDDGASAKIEVQVEARGNSNSSATPELEMGVGVETTKGSRVSGTSFKLAVPISSSSPTCPAADGSVKYSSSLKGSRSSYDADRIGKVEIDSVATTVSASGSLKSDYVMTDNAQLPARIPFKTNINFDYTVLAKVLGVPVQNIKVGAKATASGAVDSKSGQVLPGTNMDVKVTASGVAKAKVESSMTSAALKAMRAAVGSLYADAKKLEKNALQGGCTKIVFDPKTFSRELTAGEKLDVEARLDTVSGATVSGPVRMTASATIGSVAHDGAARANPAKMTVTAADRKPISSEVRVSLVSRAGISRVTWNAKHRVSFPKTYTGTMEVHYDREPFANATVKADMTAAITYTFVKQRENDEGKTIADYKPTSARLLTYDYESTNGIVVHSGSIGAPMVIQDDGALGGFLSVVVGEDGKWACRVYANLVGDFISLTSDSAPPLQHPPHLGLDTTAPGNLNRPMPTAGPITGTNVTAFNILAYPDGTARASWNFQPAG